MLAADSRDAAPQGWWSSRGAGVLTGDLQHGHGCPGWGIEHGVAAWRCRPCRKPARERGSSSSSSLRLLEEAISGRAGSSYHSLLTPGRQEGETASPPRPAAGACARRDGTTRPRHPCDTPKQGHGVPQGGGHPQCAHPNVHSSPNATGWLCPCPASTERKAEWRALAPFTPTSANVFWGPPS